MKKTDDIENKIREAARGLAPRDFQGFARKCAILDEALGVVVELHADSADGNSPDVGDWIEHTVSEWISVQGMTTEEARSWWTNEYYV